MRIRRQLLTSVLVHLLLEVGRSTNLKQTYGGALEAEVTSRTIVGLKRVSHTTGKKSKNAQKRRNLVPGKARNTVLSKGLPFLEHRNVHT